MSFEVGRISARLDARFDDSDFDRFDRRYEEARRRVRDKLEARLGADVDQRPFDRYHRQLNQTERRTNKFGTAVGASFGGLRFAAFGAASAATGAAGIITKAFVDTAADIGESTSKIRTILGRDASRTIEHFAKTSADSFGLSRAAALEAAGGFAGMFDLMGKSAPEAAKMSVRMTKLAADMASFNNASPEEALTALQSGLRGEAEPLRRFNVLLDDATLRQQAVRDGLIKTTKDALTPQQKAMAAYGVILAQTGKQQGDFERTSGGLPNLMRRVRAQVSDAGAALGERLLPHVRDGAVAVNRWMREWDRGRGPLQAAENGIRAVGSVIGATIDEIRGGIAFVRRNQTAFEALAGAAAGLLVVRTVTRLFAAFRAALVAATLAQMRLNLAMRANPIGIVVTVLAALAGALVVAYKRSDTFREKVDEAFRKIKSAAGDAIAFILRMLDRYLGGLSTLATVMGKLPGPLGKPFRDAAGKIDNAREKIRALANEADALGKKKIKPITVRVNVALGPGGKQYRPGDGWGIEDAARDLAKRQGEKMDISQIIGSIGLGGGAIGGTGLTAFNHLAARFGVRIGSGLRPGAITESGRPSMHAAGRARDFPGPPANMMRFALYLAQKYGSRLAELIYTPMGFSIKNGRRVPPYAQADHYDHVHVAMRHGGKVGPTAGGASIRIAGEGSLDEWIVSQEGDRQANIGYAIEALRALTGRNVAFYRHGGKHRGRKRRAPKPTLSTRDNRGIKRSVSRGEAGISTFEREIQGLEREYDQADRRFGISEEILLIEHDDGSTTIDQTALGTRLAEIDALIRKRDQIKRKIEAYRRAIANLMRALNDAIRKLKRALAAAKGKSRRKERGKYREEIATYQDRIGELRNTHEDLGFDIEDQRIDLHELGAERAAVATTTGTAAPAAPADAPAAADTAPAPDAPAPEAAPPSPAEIAAAAFEQFAAFQAGRAALFSDYGANFVRAGANPFVGEAGLAAGRRFYGGGSRGDGGVLEQAGGITQNINLTIASERDAHMFTRVALHELQAAI